MLPSIKTLTAVFGDNAREARKLLEATREDLLARPECEAMERQCFGRCETWRLRMTALDTLADTCGVESFELTHGRRAGQWVEYLNTGETYATTLLRVGGRYVVGCWGDYAERFTA